MTSRRYRIASFYLQHHSRDVLNQALPPILMRTVRGSFVCAEEGEAGNEATPLVNARILSSTGEVTGSSGVSGVRWPSRLALQCCTSLVMESRKACLRALERSYKV